MVFNHSASAREVYEHARKAVEAIRELRAIGLPGTRDDSPSMPIRVPELLRTLNKELRALIVEYLNDQTRAHVIPQDEDILDELRAAGWEEFSSPRWNAYGEIDDIDFEMKDGYEPGLLVVTTQLWIPCGSSDLETAIYVFQRKEKSWNLVLATDADFDPVGEHQISGLDYKISPQDSSGKWFMVVGHVPPSCERRTHALRYEALRPSGDPDKPTVLVTGRETFNTNFDPAFRIDAHEHWFALTLGKTRRLDDSLGVAILRYDVGDKVATRMAPLALTADDFLEQWTQLAWEEAKRWSGDSESLPAWHKKLNELKPGTLEIEAVRLCRGAKEGDQDWLLELSVDQAPNPSFGPEDLYVEIAKRNGAFSVDRVLKDRPKGCAEESTLTATVPPAALPHW